MIVNVYHPGSVDGDRHLLSVLAYHGHVPTLGWGYSQAAVPNRTMDERTSIAQKSKKGIGVSGPVIYGHTVMMRMNKCINIELHE